MVDPIKLSPNPNVNWANDHLQFARLIAELESTLGFPVTDALCEAMDLSKDEVREIIGRAQQTWDVTQANTGYYFDVGDWVWWNDPDTEKESNCSCFGVVHRLKETHVVVRRYDSHLEPTPYLPVPVKFVDMCVEYGEIVPAITKMCPEKIRRYRIDELVVESCKRLNRVSVYLRESENPT